MGKITQNPRIQRSGSPPRHCRKCSSRLWSVMSDISGVTVMNPSARAVTSVSISCGPCSKRSVNWNIIRPSASTSRRYVSLIAAVLCGTTFTPRGVDFYKAGMLTLTNSPGAIDVASRSARTSLHSRPARRKSISPAPARLKATEGIPNSAPSAPADTVPL